MFRIFHIIRYCVRFIQSEKDWLNIIFFCILDVKLCKRLNGVLLTIDQHKDLTDKPIQNIYCINKLKTGGHA